MRQVTEVLTCDNCGKTKATSYVYIGAMSEMIRFDPLSSGHRENTIYEVRPAQHICGKCANAIAVAVTARVADLRKKEAGNA